MERSVRGLKSCVVMVESVQIDHTVVVQVAVADSEDFKPVLDFTSKASIQVMYIRL